MEGMKHVCVVVLGDIGRSPRMQYHALSLAQRGSCVDLVGYGNTDPSLILKKENLILYHYLLDYPKLPFPRFINYVFKTIWQIITLLFVLFMLKPADVMLVQNPPAIPSLFVCWLVCVIRKTKLVIDWHNYAHTIMALNVGSSSNPLVKITQFIERFIGQKAQANFCVTNAMKKDLKQNWNITATTLYDRPPLMYKPRTLDESHRLFLKLSESYEEFLAKNGDSGTAFTEKNVNGEVVGKVNRPALLVSSTSWTEDEDFSVLLTALENYERHINVGNVKKLPKLICVITGKGPLKQFYCDKIDLLKLENVSVITPWLEAEDYAVLLASADLGVCLHTSSSGLDLPMKVVDMFGCGLPVCAYNFKCLDELVKHGVNSYVFNDTEELTNQIFNWFEGFPLNEKQMEIQHKFKKELEYFQELRWEKNWTNVAASEF